MKPTSFSQYITTTRERKGYSERHLARLVGVANTTIIRIEQGSIPQPELLIGLIDALDLDVITAVRLIEPYKRLYERIITAQGDSGDTRDDLHDTGPQ